MPGSRESASPSTEAVDADARTEAQAQWNARACGQLDGSPTSVDYFLRVEADRYRQQPWCHQYFGYKDFAGKKVLEIGVGQGTDLAQFAAAGARCHAIDITENHLDLARTNLTLRGLTADIRRADATQIPFPDEYFDAVYSFGVLHHVPEIDAVLREIRRVLAPGGRLMVALYHRWSAFYLVKKLLAEGVLRGRLLTLGHAGLLSTVEEGADGLTIKPYVRLYSRASLRRVLSGFTIDDVSIHQLSPGHFVPWRWLGRWQHARMPGEAWLGWYVAARATKGA